MARFRFTDNQEPQPIPARTLIGRSSSCFLKIDRPYVSGEHALLQYAEGSWFVRDLGSRNGTFVDGNFVQPGTSVRLSTGSRVSFGDNNETWILERDDPPEPMAIDLASREIRAAENGLLALPSDSDPEATVFDRGDGQWLVENKGSAEPARDQQVISVGGRTWSLLLPENLEATPLVETELTLEKVDFHFAVSRDEERVELTVSSRGKRVAIGTRDYNYALLLLARTRLAQRELPITDRGWIELQDLLRMLRMRENTLNVAIHRARQFLADAGIAGGAGIVEIRLRQRRFGSDRVTIGPLGS
jgi:hypothetical protein